MKKSEYEIFKNLKTIENAKKDLLSLSRKASGVVFNKWYYLAGFMLYCGLGLIAFHLAFVFMGVVSDEIRAIFSENENLLVVGGATIFSAFSVYGNYKDEQKQESVFKDFVNVLNEKYHLDLQPDEKAFENFNDFYKKVRSEFSNDITKVDGALEEIRQENDNFTPYYDLIMVLSEKITEKRIKQNNMKEEASKRLGVPIEPEEGSIKIEEREEYSLNEE